MCYMCKVKPKNVISYIIIDDEVIWITEKNKQEYIDLGFNVGLHSGHEPCNMKEHNKRIIDSVFKECVSNVFKNLEEKYT